MDSPSRAPRTTKCPWAPIKEQLQSQDEYMRLFHTMGEYYITKGPIEIYDKANKLNELLSKDTYTSAYVLVVINAFEDFALEVLQKNGIINVQRFIRG